MAGCGRAVRLPEIEQAQPTVNYTNPNNFGDFKPPPATSHAVDCGNSHFFCWECLGEAHAPCGCIQWQQWQQKISEIKPEELRANCDESESAANCLWLVTNSKPCPNCKSPIQKNEGCNHMKCSKVREVSIEACGSNPCGSFSVNLTSVGYVKNHGNVTVQQQEDISDVIDSKQLTKLMKSKAT